MRLATSMHCTMLVLAVATGLNTMWRDACRGASRETLNNIVRALCLSSSTYGRGSMAGSLMMLA